MHLRLPLNVIIVLEEPIRASIVFYELMDTPPCIRIHFTHNTYNVSHWDEIEFRAVLLIVHRRARVNVTLYFVDLI